MVLFAFAKFSCELYERSAFVNPHPNEFSASVAPKSGALGLPHVLSAFAVTCSSDAEEQKG